LYVSAEIIAGSVYAAAPGFICSRIWVTSTLSNWNPRCGSGSTRCPLLTYRTVEYHADHLAEAPTTLGEPYSWHLRGSTRELCFHLRRSSWRVSYWLAPRRRIVLLTVFRKTRGREAAEVERAVAAQRVCEEQHQAATHVYDREE
jgi:hypothetical protein